jgi:hypothetical protein
MGLFSRGKRTEATAEDTLTPVFTDPVTGRSRTGQIGYPIVPLLINEWALRDLDALPEDKRPIVLHLDSGLDVGYAFDTPERFVYVNRDQLDDLGHTAQTLHEEATRWLRQTAAERLEVGGNGRYRLELPGTEDLTASLILTPDVWLDRVELDGAPIVAVGHRIMLHVCGSNDTEGVDGLRGLAKALFETQEAKPVSPELFVLGSEGEISRLDG